MVLNPKKQFRAIGIVQSNEKSDNTQCINAEMENVEVVDDTTCEIIVKDVTLDKHDENDRNANSVKDDKHDEVVKDNNSVSNIDLKNDIAYIEKSQIKLNTFKYMYCVVLTMLEKWRLIPEKVNYDNRDYSISPIIEMVEDLLYCRRHAVQINVIINEIRKVKDEKSALLFCLLSNIRYAKYLSAFYIYKNNEWQKVYREDLSYYLICLLEETRNKFFKCDDENINKDEEKIIENLKQDIYVSQLLRQVITIEELNEKVSEFINKEDLLKISNNCSFATPIFTDRCEKLKFDKELHAPKWEKFISDIFQEDKDLISYIQRALGYCFLEDNNEQIAFFLLGSGSNGKTTFLEVIKRVFGNNATVVDNTILTKKSNKSKNEYIKLKDKNIAIINELDNDATIKADCFKILTGGDTMELHRPNKETQTFSIGTKFFVSCNSMPQINENSDAVWRRIKIIPFNNKFEDDNKNIFMKQELFNEIEGIKNWIIEGYEKIKSGERLIEPSTIKETTNVFREVADPIKDFLTEKCEINPNSNEVVKSKDIYESYKKWCDENNILAIGQNKVGMLLVERGIKPYRSSSGRGYIGIKINS